MEEIKKQFTKEFKEVSLTLDKSAEMENGNLRFVASKEIRDRDNDVVFIDVNAKGSGIDTSEFVKNPLFLAFHDLNSFPIGKVVTMEKSKDDKSVNQFVIEVEYAETDEGKKAKYLAKNGFMPAVSIRFRPKDYVYNADANGFDIFSCTLYEVSQVCLPANQEALLIKSFEELEKGRNELKKNKETEQLIIGELNAIAKSLGAPSVPAKTGNNHKAIMEAVLDLKAKFLK